jgi:hypothetical protein
MMRAFVPTQLYGKIQNMLQASQNFSILYVICFNNKALATTKRLASVFSQFLELSSKEDERLRGMLL